MHQSLSQSLTKGWKHALPAASAPLLSDGPIIAFCLLVLSQVPSWLQQFLYVTGGFFILYLAYGAYRSWKSFDPNISATETGMQQSVLKAALINILNPNPYIFWTLVTGPILLAGWRETPVYGLGFLIGFYVTMILGFCTIIIASGSARQLGSKVNRALLGVSAIALFCFGLYQLWKGIAG
ncbi:MAG TPA: LysE family transporter [Anaerolineales bacterium]|nr:LysE family transporter [Anaerolineales bacterium]